MNPKDVSMLNEKALEAARATPIGSERHEVITAYLSALPMPDVKGLVEDINSQIGDDVQKVFLPEALLRRCSAVLTTLSAKVDELERERGEARAEFGGADREATLALHIKASLDQLAGIAKDGKQVSTSLGEPVAWRYRWPKTNGEWEEWDYTDDEEHARSLAADDGEVEPLYARSARSAK